MESEELRRRAAVFGQAELPREGGNETTILCRCPDCEGTVPVFRDWDTGAMAPITLGAVCQTCNQVWTITELGERIVGVRSRPAWSNPQR